MPLLLLAAALPDWLQTTLGWALGIGLILALVFMLVVGGVQAGALLFFPPYALWRWIARVRRIQKWVGTDADEDGYQVARREPILEYVGQEVEHIYLVDVIKLRWRSYHVCVTRRSRFRARDREPDFCDREGKPLPRTVAQHVRGGTAEEWWDDSRALIKEAKRLAA